MTRQLSMFLSLVAFVLIFLIPAGCAVCQAARAKAERWQEGQSAAVQMLDEQAAIQGGGRTER
jgi:hypothetical protein